MSKKPKNSLPGVATLAAPVSHAVVVPVRDRTLRFNERWNYSPAPEIHTDLKIRPRYDLFIGGKFVQPSSGKYFPSINPATEKQHAEIALGSAADVDKAVKAARRAYGKDVGQDARTRARRVSLPHCPPPAGENPRPGCRSNPLTAARRSARAATSICRWSPRISLPRGVGRQAGLRVSRPPTAAARGGGSDHPLNFPLLMAAWKLAPALACGNTCVLKPAETTSVTAMHLAEILAEADLPDGVVNIVTGFGDTGAAIVNHPDINKLAFTGSTEVGKMIAKSVAGTRKKLTLELGAKRPTSFVKTPRSTKRSKASSRAFISNQGHVCCAGSRLFVQESIVEPVIRRLRNRLSVLRVGDPLDKNTDIGAINSREQLEKIRAMVASGKKRAPSCSSPRCKLPSKGYFYAPSFSPG